MNWKEQAYENLNMACVAIANEQLRQGIVLLDDAVGIIAQGHLNEIGKAPSLNRNGRSPSIPIFFKAMLTNATPKLSRKNLNILLEMHEIRNILVHQIDKNISLSKKQSLHYLQRILLFIQDYGVERPKLVPSDLKIEQPIAKVLVDLYPKWNPKLRSVEDRKLVIETMERRGLLAGINTAVNWPLVKCTLCKNLVSIEDLFISQNDCMTEEDEEVRPYCAFGCVQAHQKYMKEYESEWIERDPCEYFVHPLLSVVTGVPYELKGIVYDNKPNVNGKLPFEDFIKNILSNINQETED